ncbi:MAG: lipopolysaccharide biosynthesis protein [Pyrinomonadaceae bacterium]
MSNDPQLESQGVPKREKKEHFKTDHLNDDIGGRTARGGFVTMTSHLLKFFITLVATIVMARLLTPEDYGLIGMVIVFTNYMTMFKDMGLSLATVQRAEISFEQISTLFWINVLLSFGITVLAIALAPGIAFFYGEPRLILITIVVATGFILGGLSVQHEALLKRQMRFGALATISTVALVVGYVVGIVAAWSGAGYWAIVASQLSLIGTSTLGTWIVSGWIPGRPRRGTGVRPMLTFGRNITGYATINVLAKNLDTLMLGRYWGAQNLGLYQKASLLVAIPTDGTNEPFNSVAIPALSRLVDSPERYREAFLRILEKVALLTMPCVAALIATSDWVVQLLLGPQWTASGRILIIIAIAGLFQPIVSATHWLFVTQGRTHHMFQWALIYAPLSVISVFAGLKWGPLGVAISYAIGRLCLIDHLLYWFAGRTGPVRTVDIYKVVAPIAAASALGAGAALCFRQVTHIQNPLLGCILCGLIVVLVTALALYFIPAGRRALVDIKSLLRLLTGRAEAAVAENLAGVRPGSAT